MKRGEIFKNMELRYWSYFLIGSVLVSIAATFFSVDFVSALRAILGAVYVLFLPGYVVVREFFNDKDLDWIERAALCFGLSIALVILSVIFSNMIFKIPITPVNNFLVLLAVMILTVLIKKYQKNIEGFLSGFGFFK